MVLVAMESVVADSETLCMDGDIDLNDLDYSGPDSAASAFLEQNLVEFEEEEEEENTVLQKQSDKDDYDLEATIRGVFYDDDDEEETEIATPFNYQSSYENYEPTFANFNQHTSLSHQEDQSAQTSTDFAHTHISIKYKRYKNYSKETMMMAVNELRKGKTVGAVHKIFPSIPPRTLYERAKRFGIVSNNHMKTRTMPHTRFSDYQVKILQEFFGKDAYPKDNNLIQYLSKLLKLAPRVIRDWFQNARTKFRNELGSAAFPPLQQTPGSSEVFMQSDSYESKPVITGIQQSGQHQGR